MWKNILHGKMLAGTFAALLPLAIGISAAWVKGPFHPLIHDEYSYLLAADTYSHWRLTNPAHPFWPHFEAVDILNLPTRMSRKPPANGLFLAAGQILTGKPIAGALLAAALAAAAVYWALLAWLSPPWALLGALLAGTHPVLFAWSVSYWGGNVSVLGGALALGAWRRAMDRPAPKTGAVLGLGLALLANSRPFEGLIFALPLGLTLGRRFFGGGQGRLAKSLASLLPLNIILVLTTAAMGYYNFRVTGDALRFPYVAYEKSYNSVPLFIWQDLKPPQKYRTPDLDQYFNRWNRELGLGQETWAGYFSMVHSKLSTLADDWLRTWPLKLFFAAALLGGASPALTLLLAVYIGGITCLTRATMLAHYSAPGGILFFLILLLALRRLSEWRWRTLPLGRAAAAAVIFSCLLNSWNAYADFPSGALNPCAKIKEGFYRHVRARSGQARHLVFVQYSPAHSIYQGWLYNEANMDDAQVVWASELSRAENCRLIKYYGDRTPWLLDVVPPKADFKLLRPSAYCG